MYMQLRFGSASSQCPRHRIGTTPAGLSPASATTRPWPTSCAPSCRTRSATVTTTVRETVEPSSRVTEGNRTVPVTAVAEALDSRCIRGVRSGVELRSRRPPCRAYLSGILPPSRITSAATIGCRGCCCRRRAGWEHGVREWQDAGAGGALASCRKSLPGPAGWPGNRVVVYIREVVERSRV